MLRKNPLLKIFAAALAITLVVGMSAIVYGTNTSSDPLVTLSYLTGTYKSSVLSEMKTAVAASQKQLASDFSSQIAGLKSSLPSSIGTVAATSDYETVNLTAGQNIALVAGGEVLFLSGSAKVDAAALTDTTAGKALSAGGALTENHLYVATGDCMIEAPGNVKLLVK